MSGLTKSNWRIHEWKAGRTKELRASDILRPARGEEPAPSVAGMLNHAENSYLACRVLFLGSQVLHPPALYMAAQTIEKFLKAILLFRGEEPGLTHNIAALARSAGDPFDDREFVAVCEDLGPFEVAGRYDDGHDYVAWRYSLDLLSLLDVFVVQARWQINTVPDGYENRAARLLSEQSGNNVVIQAAQEALRDGNAMLDAIVRGPADRRPR